MSTPFERFLDNGEHVVELLKLHAEKNADKKTHHTHEILTKSCLVLLVACWEAFIEDTAEAAVAFLVSHTASPKDLPKELLRFISTELKNSKNDQAVWELAGEGWKNVVQTHYKAMLSKHLGPFNTPRAGNIDNLFHAVLAIEKLSSCWVWKGMSNQHAKDVLSEAITLRGSIAHRVQASQKVTSALANRYGIHLFNLAIKTSNKMRIYLYSVTGEYPWVEESYGSVK
ncbi:MAG: hypothetical protein HY850_05720 [Betaproteobacteria bacterium]|nr:hypothetical protein [Betaproteobacteria bacterium]